MSFPARLHFILARKAPYAIVIRRGPTRRTCTIGWDLSTDTFTLGQWLHGRIYERRCDLSPDARHLLYFAMNGRWETTSKGAWTAISRAPYLKALTFLPKGDCWNGGGLFITDREYALNDRYATHEVGHDDSGLRRAKDFDWNESYGGECPGVYYLRLQRDGWTMQAPGDDAPSTCRAVFDTPVDAAWTLRMYAHASYPDAPGRGCYFDTFALLRCDGSSRIECPDWECAHVDRGRLVWASGGCLYAASMTPQGPGEVRLLHDFNGMRFERRQAPC